MDFITEDFIDYIIRVEGSKKRRGKHYAYKSPEGGAKTIGYGHKIKKGENFSSGLTENQAKLLLESDLTDAAQGVQKSIGKDWDTLDPKRQQMLVDMQFNLGNVKKKFPKFTKAVINNDQEGMVAEYKRYFKPSMDTGKRSHQKLNGPNAGQVVLEPEKQTTKKRELKDRNEQFFQKYLMHPDAQGDNGMAEEDMGMTLAQNDTPPSRMRIDPDQQKVPVVDGVPQEPQRGRSLEDQELNEIKIKDSFSQGDTEAYLANSEKSKKAIEHDYRSILAKGMKLIHGRGSRENMLRALSSSNPIDAISNVTVAVISRIDAAMEQAGKKISDEVKVLAANNIMGQIIEVGEASGVVELDDQERELAFSTAINRYLDNEIKAGRIDRKTLSEEAGRSVANMSEDQRQQIHEQLERINQTAESSQSKYGIQSKMPGMLGRGGQGGGMGGDMGGMA